MILSLRMVSGKTSRERYDSGNGFHAARFKGFSGTLPSQRSGRKGNCLSTEGASFAFAAKRDVAGSKKISERK
jgi:hypothetical protein